MLTFVLKLRILFVRSANLSEFAIKIECFPTASFRPFVAELLSTKRRNRSIMPSLLAPLDHFLAFPSCQDASCTALEHLWAVSQATFGLVTHSFEEAQHRRNAYVRGFLASELTQ